MLPSDRPVVTSCSPPRFPSLSACVYTNTFAPRSWRALTGIVTTFSCFSTVIVAEAFIPSFIRSSPGISTSTVYFATPPLELPAELPTFVTVPAKVSPSMASKVTSACCPCETELISNSSTFTDNTIVSDDAIVNAATSLSEPAFSTLALWLLSWLLFCEEEALAAGRLTFCPPLADEFPAPPAFPATASFPVLFPPALSLSPSVSAFLLFSSSPSFPFLSPCVSPVLLLLFPPSVLSSLSFLVSSF